MKKALALLISLIVGLVAFHLLNVILSIREGMDPTLSPTLAPTLPPTDAPTLPPTDAPTLPPTDAPTLPPTLAPTNAPTTPTGGGGGGGGGGGDGGGHGGRRGRHPYFWSRGTGDGRNSIWDHYYYPSQPYYGNQIEVEEPAQPIQQNKKVSWSSALIIVGVVVLGLSSAMKK